MAAYDKAITRDVQLIHNGITKKKKKKKNGIKKVKKIFKTFFKKFSKNLLLWTGSLSNSFFISELT